MSCEHYIEHLSRLFSDITSLLTVSTLVLPLDLSKFGHSPYFPNVNINLKPHFFTFTRISEIPGDNAGRQLGSCGDGDQRGGGQADRHGGGQGGQGGEGGEGGER